MDNPNTLSSPCDGRVLTFGELNKHNNTIDCVKGRNYRLDEFMLGERED
jgi:phosphatidylserine decarboxylase